ncbi:HAMP domain-containing sensor histidine kinase [Actinopolymorpha sp. B17G11]|uniref:sensor histidine kinase n=1 Tax=unclassified Actinopolymorpha TaxID=2627063 RepID=UPI0032D8D197
MTDPHSLARSATPRADAPRPAGRRRWLRPTLRLRLTLLYGGLFFAAGLVLLAVTYVLVSQRMPEATGLFTARVTGPGTRLPDEAFIRTSEGDLLTASEASRYVATKQAELRRATLTSLLTQGAIALGLVGSAAAGFGWLIAGRVLAPLHRVTETARRIADAKAADRSLHERIALRGADDEVKELADTFDTMVERLDKSFDGQRHFVANASHELRTPLTLNRALVEVAMHRKNASPDVQQLGETLLEINTRHERLINGLLLLARSENDVVERTPVDLADVVIHVTAHASGAAREQGIVLRDKAAEAPTAGDPVLLERLVQNLVDNGIRHNLSEGGFVDVASRRHPDGWVEVVVSNSGDVIPPYDIPQLFEPFRRLGTDRLVTAKGAGLGLSIVRSIAHAHGGDVVARPRPDGGLVVTVALPGAPEVEPA